jgi:hypothetical protein
MTKEEEQKQDEKKPVTYAEVSGILASLSPERLNEFLAQTPYDSFGGALARLRDEGAK